MKKLLVLPLLVAGFVMLNGCNKCSNSPTPEPVVQPDSATPPMEPGMPSSDPHAPPAEIPPATPPTETK